MAIRTFISITEELLKVLENRLDQEREDTIAVVSELLEQRETLLKDINPPFADEDRVLGQKAVELNQKLDYALNLQKQEIQHDIKELNRKKKSSNQYTNPYESLSVDGAFYDRKK